MNTQENRILAMLDRKSGLRRSFNVQFKKRRESRIRRLNCMLAQLECRKKELQDEKAQLEDELARRHTIEMLDEHFGY